MIITYCVYFFVSVAPDGNYCLYVANTDRSVVVYRWNEETKHLDMLNRFSLHGQVGYTD